VNSNLKAALFGIGSSIVTAGLKMFDSSDIKIKVFSLVLVLIGSGLCIYTVEKVIEQGVHKAIEKIMEKVVAY
jgi:hypothetical protein